MDRTVHDCSTMIVPYDCICTVSEDVYSKVPEWSIIYSHGSLYTNISWKQWWWEL